MTKKVFILTMLALLLMASSVSAFELVEKKSDKGTTGIGIEIGQAFGSSYHSSFTGITGGYHLSNQFSVRGSLGYTTNIYRAYPDHVGVYYSLKPTYYLVNTHRFGLFGYAIASNLSSYFLSPGLGIGVERIQLNDLIKISTEFSYSLDQIALWTAGFVYYF